MERIPIILVVEDDPLIQSVVEETLTDGGFEIPKMPCDQFFAKRQNKRQPSIDPS